MQELGDDTYRLRSYVDAENAFGGEVRTNFVCTVTGTRVTEFVVAE